MVERAGVKTLSRICEMMSRPVTRSVTSRCELLRHLKHVCRRAPGLPKRSCQINENVREPPLWAIKRVANASHSIDNCGDVQATSGLLRPTLLTKSRARCRHDLARCASTDACEQYAAASNAARTDIQSTGGNGRLFAAVSVLR